jgi:hypothetical protein
LSRASVATSFGLALSAVVACINFDEAEKQGCLAAPGLCPTDGGSPDAGNPGPTIALTFGDASPSFTLTGQVTDADGVQDVVISWGDSTADTTMVSGFGAINANHVYSAPGTYNVAVTARDALLEPSSADFVATVNVPTNGLLVRLRFNGDHLDSSPYPYPFTFTGVGTSEPSGYVADRASTATSAFQFHPNFVGDDYSFFTGTTVPTLDVAQNFTVTMWVKLTGGNGNQGTVLSQDDNWQINFFSLLKPRIQIRGVVVEDDQSLTSDVWHHVAFVKSGLAVTIYVDGGIVHTDTIAAQINACSNVGLIVNGLNTSVSCQNFPSNSFSGHTVDDIRVYNRDLSAAELALVYNEAP